MASTRPVPPKAAAATPPKAAGKAAATKAGSGTVAAVSARSVAAREPLAAAKGEAGWRAARGVLGAALAAADSALLLGARGQTVVIQRRSGDAWQTAEPLAGEDAGRAFLALRKLAAAAGAADPPEFLVTAKKLPRRACRVFARAAAGGEQVLVLFGPELPPPERLNLGRLIGGFFARLVPSFLKRKPPPPERDPTLPRVALEAMGPEAAARQAACAEAEGLEQACDLVAAAVRDRAGAILFAAGPQGLAVQFDVDGVHVAAPQLDKAAVAGVVGVFRSLAGLDPKERGPQTGKLTALVEGKPWACSLSGRRGSSGERLELSIDHVRPKLKTLADAGMPAAMIDRLQEFLKLESGLILLVSPPRGGLSTLFDGVLGTADRLLRDFILIEDAAAPRPEIQNVRPFRYDSRQGETPLAVLETALRQYANVLTTCDLADADLAKRLVTEAGEGKFVIAGIRGADAADGIARLTALGVDPEVLARVLLGVVGVQLVRKLCPKCRQEYLPPFDVVTKLKLDPESCITLQRAAAGGCPACTGTGYLGRTAACELASGPTLRAYVAKGAEKGVLRKAAAKDGMETVVQDAISKAAVGITSIEEVMRVFRKE